MTKVVIVGEVYYGDRGPDQGLPQPPLGIWGPGFPYPDQGLPGGGQGGQPSHPIYHPGHPDHGLPSQPGHPSHPIAGQPGQPTHPIHIPGVPDQGLPPGTDIPPDQINPPLPDVPPELESQLIIAVHQPGAEEWKVTAYPVGPDRGSPPTNPGTPTHPIQPPPTGGAPAPTPHQAPRPGGVRR